MNIEKMKQFMKEHEIKSSDVAKALGINESTWFRKIGRNGETVTIKEMNAIIEEFNIPMSEAAEIFFDEKLA